MTTRSPSTRAAVYRELRRRIVSLRVAPGAALSENDLAAELGVSRTPVREALITLQAEGLVEVLDKVGTFVALVDADRVRDAQFLRESVELASLSDLPAALEGHDGVAPLLANLAAQREVLQDDDAFFELDEAFHAGLMALAGHGGVWPTVAAAKTHLDRARRLAMAHAPANSEMLAQHEAVLAAVRDGDQAKARAVLRAHLREVVTSLQAVRAASPELFGVRARAIRSRTQPRPSRSPRG